MLLSLIAIAGGFVVLVWGADRFVVGAAATARNLGVAPLIIGLTIVGFGTSAPEVLVSALAAWQGNPFLSIGNALGSNITNIALVIGATAIIQPLQVNSTTLRREFPLLLAVMVMVFVLLSDGDLSRLDGLLLSAALVAHLGWLVAIGLKTRRCDPVKPEACESDPMAREFDMEIPSGMSTPVALGWTVVGSVALLTSSRTLVWGAVNVATALGVSDLVIGLTVVALGTSLPELAASVTSAWKGEHDIALGNVIGSNIFNLLAVMGAPALIHPGPFERAVLVRDYPTMIGLTLLLFAMAYGFRGRSGHVTRSEGALLLLLYGIYTGFLALNP